ncbi:MAG: 2-hydroxychromene-2-carboxylate isomerase [Hyphomonas sp. TMED17]|nr:MAG: 2-hydroxychromene-2-carboxylate isomerase [Hyphomonas sp. TMED17]
MRKDLQDWAKLAGLEITFPPSIFPINSVKAMRACIVLNETGLLVAFAEQIFRAYWSDNLDISDEAVLTSCLEAVGADAGAVLTAIKSDDVKAELRANTEALIARGGFGSPTFFIGEDMFFGNDRLPLVDAALVKLSE